MTTTITKTGSNGDRTDYYTAIRNGSTYYVSDNHGVGFGVSQKYAKRNGMPASRRVPEGKLRAELVAAVEQHKTAPLRVHLCQPVTIGEAAALLA